jgi:hypothetical protein
MGGQSQWGWGGIGLSRSTTLARQGAGPQGHGLRLLLGWGVQMHPPARGRRSAVKSQGKVLLHHNHCCVVSLLLAGAPPRPPAQQDKKVGPTAPLARRPHPTPSTPRCAHSPGAPCAPRLLPGVCRAPLSRAVAAAGRPRACSGGGAAGGAVRQPLTFSWRCRGRPPLGSSPPLSVRAGPQSCSRQTSASDAWTRSGSARGHRRGGRAVPAKRAARGRRGCTGARHARDPAARPAAAGQQAWLATGRQAGQSSRQASQAGRRRAAGAHPHGFEVWGVGHADWALVPAVPHGPALAICQPRLPAPLVLGGGCCFGCQLLGGVLLSLRLAGHPWSAGGGRGHRIGAHAASAAPGDG